MKKIISSLNITIAGTIDRKTCTKDRAIEIITGTITDFYTQPKRKNERYIKKHTIGFYTREAQL